MVMCPMTWLVKASMTPLYREKGDPTCIQREKATPHVYRDEAIRHVYRGG